MHNMHTPRAVGYTRLSMADRPGGYSLDAQRTAIRRYCALRGYRLEGVYADRQLCAPTDWLADRPQLSLLLHHARAGQFDVVVVRDLDRVARNDRVRGEVLRSLGEAEVTLVSVREHLEFDFATPAGRALVAVLEFVAECFELDRAVRSAPVPFGYRRDRLTGVTRLVPVPHEAEAVRTAFRIRAAGATTGTIAAWLNAGGYRTRKGRYFTARAVRDMLSSRSYLGIRTVKGREYPGKHERIVTPDLFKCAQARRARVPDTSGERDCVAGLRA